MRDHAKTSPSRGPRFIKPISPVASKKIGLLKDIVKKNSNTNNAMSTPAVEFERFKPTPAAGNLTPELLKKLKSEAPETLVAPNRSGFGGINAGKSYKEARKKFKKYGNWASDK